MVLWMMSWARKPSLPFEMELCWWETVLRDWMGQDGWMDGMDGLVTKTGLDEMRSFMSL